MSIVQQLVIFLSAVTDPVFVFLLLSSSFLLPFLWLSAHFPCHHFVSLTSHIAITLCCYHVDACTSFLHLFLVAFHFSLPFLDVFFLP